MRYFFSLMVAVGIGSLLIWCWENRQLAINTSTSEIRSDDVVAVQEQRGTLERSPLSKTLSPEIMAPLGRMDERVTKKPFGILIDPKTSPVQPEKFSGYHTGIDFETFSDEAKSDVSVVAMCTGPVVEKRFATGYGGVIVTRCTVRDEPVTVVYGHLSLETVLWRVGETLQIGERVGLLGAGGSRETDGERKHLHLGIHRGTVVNLRGYVNTKKELLDWLDPSFILKSGAGVK